MLREDKIGRGDTETDECNTAGRQVNEFSILHVIIIRQGSGINNNTDVSSRLLTR